MIYLRSKVPLAGAELFHPAPDELADGQIRVRMAAWQGEDVAAGIGIVSHLQFCSYYAAVLSGSFYSTISMKGKSYFI